MHKGEERCRKVVSGSNWHHKVKANDVVTFLDLCKCSAFSMFSIMASAQRQVGPSKVSRGHTVATVG